MTHATAAGCETRSAGKVEVRAEDNGGTVKVAGYAAVFNQRTRIGDFFEEEIAPGAFDGRLGDDCVFLVDHQGLPLARVRSGTLKLSVDARGLYVESDLDPADPDVAQVVTKMRRGDLDKMSFAFLVERETWDESGDLPLRRIEKIKQLRDVSVVTFPAFEGTEISLRSLEAHRASAAGPETQAERQRRLRMQLALQGGA